MKRNYQLILGTLLTAIMAMCFPVTALAATTGDIPSMTGTTYGIAALIIFVFAYALVIGEEQIHMRKSKPVMVAAGLIWVLVALAYASAGVSDKLHGILEHNIIEYAYLMLFLLAAMTYINTLEERNVFAALRAWLVSKGFSLYAIFWITGVLAFFISPIADNLTTALLMAAVVMAVAGDKKTYVGMACINIVVAANAGGAFSPFGDITTLMVWQAGIVEFTQFFALFIPSVVNWIVPALIMSFFIEKGQPEPLTEEVQIKPGGIVVIFLFIGTIATAVTFHNSLHLPPALGMMTGLGVLKVYGYFLRKGELGVWDNSAVTLEGVPDTNYRPATKPFDVFISVKRAEWDTLFFFYGVILCVGGLGALGYLATIAQVMYVDLGATWANVLVGVLSAIVDNIPVMFAVLSMEAGTGLNMDLDQWLLVTLTAGVGGSMLSIGSAAGVALMGQARGYYTFFGHLKWAWAIALGYAASIVVHILMSGI